MAHYRVPFHGTVLVEAETPVLAQLSANFWISSMKEATHGVQVRRPGDEKICALEMWTKTQDPTDVTEAFAAHVEQWQARRKGHEFFYDVVEEMCRTNFSVGHQHNWEGFEMEQRHKDARDQRLQPARALLIKAVVDGVQLYQNEALIPGGYVEEQTIRESSSSEDGALRKQMQWVAERIADRYVAELMETAGGER